MTSLIESTDKKEKILDQLDYEKPEEITQLSIKAIRNNQVAASGDCIIVKNDPKSDTIDQ